MILAHDVLGASHAPRLVFFLHGILGSRNNWRSFARRIVEERPLWRAAVFDLRNHGDSHGAPPPHTVAACVEDVLASAAVVGEPDVVVGHSYGGKIALALARSKPSGLREVWVLDAPPGTRSFASGREEIDRVLAAVSDVPMPIQSRRELVEELRRRGLAEPVCQWMTTNLRSVTGERADAAAGPFVWRFDLAFIPEMLASFGSLDLWPFVESHQGAPRLIMVRGGRSDRWSGDEQSRLVRAAAQGAVVEHVLPAAGHWLHTDDPGGLWALLKPALERIETTSENEAKGG